MKCKSICQRLFLQKYVMEKAKDIIDTIDEIEKTVSNKEEQLTKETAKELIYQILK